ncbi:MAG: PulJ/GspJ family protein, partial [Candidatus Saccharimonadales bacterium]
MTTKATKTPGFTIVELLIATSVFSLVLMGALAGFIHAGQIFYKGVSVTQTGADAKQVLDDVSNSINNTGAGQIIASPSSSQYSYYCVGNVRYTYNSLHTMIDLSVGQSYNPNGNYGILRDVVSGCAAPC